MCLADSSKSQVELERQASLYEVTARRASDLGDSIQIVGSDIFGLVRSGLNPNPLQAVNNLISRGGTNIAAGISKGAKVLVDCKWKNPAWLHIGEWALLMLVSCMLKRKWIFFWWQSTFQIAPRMRWRY